MNKKFFTAVGAALFAAAVTPTSAASVGYTVDPTHTSVTAESRHFGTSTVRSHFQAKSGTVTIDPAAKTGSATIAIDVGSVETGVGKLDTHIKSDAFFDAASYPDATFKSTAFTFDGDKVAQIAGDLTMHGKTNPITLKSTNYNCYLNPNFKKQVCGGSFETTIQRTQWDVKYLVPFVSDETKLYVEIEAVKD
ncbi:MAG: YceI family protein [Burkholderiaceae bacterium]